MFKIKRTQRQEMTTKLILVVIGLTSVSAVLIPTYAVPTIRSGDILDGEVKTDDLANGAVTNPKLANDAVTSGKIKNGEVKTEDIASGAIQPNVQRVVGDGVTVTPGVDSPASADCPAGEILTGGGFDTSSLVDVHVSEPFDENTWLVRGFNDGSDDELLTAFALCIGPSP